MLKRLTLLAMSVAALLAFAAPAAQASGALITDTFGEASKFVTAISTNTTTVTANGTLECTTMDLQLSLTENSNTTAHGQGTGAGAGTPKASGHIAKHTGHCSIKETTTKVHINSVTISSLHLTRHGWPAETTGTANFQYTYELTTPVGNFHCTFEGTNVPVKRTGASTINVNGKLVRALNSSWICPTEGTFNGDFSLYMSGSTFFQVTIH